MVKIITELVVGNGIAATEGWTFAKDAQSIESS